MKIFIIGGGFLGQLLHTLFPTARVLDWRPSPPDPSRQPRQLGPQYLWEPITGLPSRRFDVVTHVDGRPATEDAILAYKLKVGKDQDGSDWRAQFRSRMDGYEVTLPPSRVEYGQRILHISRVRRELTLSSGAEEQFDVLISTIPMPSLLSLCGLPCPKLPSKPIYVDVQRSVAREQMVVNYISSPKTAVYRETYRNGELHAESLEPIGASDIRLTPGKIYNHEGTIEAILMLRSMHIYPYGRYATWSPDELAHETYKSASILARSL